MLPRLPVVSIAATAAAWGDRGPVKDLAHRVIGRARKRNAARIRDKLQVRKYSLTYRSRYPENIVITKEMMWQASAMA